MSNLRIMLLLACLLLLPGMLHAAEARAHLLIEITGDGNVHVLQKWNGIAARERLVYDTGTDELGVLEAVIHEGHAELEYNSFELLRRDGDRLRLIIARLDNAGDWLDFDITLSYPGNLEYINADPQPSFMNSAAHGLMWSIADERELILTASFSGQLNGDSRRSTGDPEARGNSGDDPDSEVRLQSDNNTEGQGSAASRKRDGNSEEVRPRSDNEPGENADPVPPADTSANAGSRMQRPNADGGPEQSGQPDRNTDNPSDSSSASASYPDGELLLDGDPLLLEFRMLINAARREGKGDEDFLAALEKLLTKFFYLLEAMGASDEYEPQE